MFDAFRLLNGEGKAYAVDTDETDRYREWAAVYVLGSFRSGERRELPCIWPDASLHSWVVELSGLPAVLDGLAPEEVQAIGGGKTPPQLSDRLAATVPWETRLVSCRSGYAYTPRIVAVTTPGVQADLKRRV